MADSARTITDALALQVEMADATARKRADKSLETLDRMRAHLETTREWASQLKGEVPVNQMGLAHQITAMLNQVNERVRWLRDELEFEADE